VGVRERKKKEECDEVPARIERERTSLWERARGDQEDAPLSRTDHGWRRRARERRESGGLGQGGDPHYGDTKKRVLKRIDDLWGKVRGSTGRGTIGLGAPGSRVSTGRLYAGTLKKAEGDLPGKGGGH